MRASFRAPFDLQPGNVWIATFVTCARITKGRFRDYTDRSQYLRDKAFIGGVTAGAKARVTLKRRDIRLGPRKRRWCKGTAVLAISEATPNAQGETGDATDFAVVEFLRIRGGVSAAYEDVFKPVPIKP